MPKPTIVALHAANAAALALVLSNLPVVRDCWRRGAEAIDVVAAESELPPPHDPQAPRDAPPAWDIANLDHSRVEYWIQRFQTDLRGEFGGFIERKGRYEALITAALEKRGMPHDLVYLAMIESGFKPLAYSKSNAA